MRLQTKPEDSEGYFLTVAAIHFYLLWGYFDVKCIFSGGLLYIDN